MSMSMGTRPETSLTALIRYFELTIRSEGKSLRTVRIYVDELRLFALWARQRGRMDISDINPWVVRDFLVYCQDPANPMGTGTKQPRCRGQARAFRYWRSLRAFYNWLLGERLVLEDPLKNIRVKRPNPENLPVYSPSELSRIMRLCALDFKVAPTKKSRAVAARNHALFLVALDTGLRRSELAGLMLEDLDLNTGVIRVRRGKGGKGRLVRVGEQTQKCLVRYLTHRQGESSQLWLTEQEKSLSVWGVAQVFRRLCHRAGVVDKGVHALRRNWCTAALRNGADLRMVQILGGWRSLTMPLHYSQSLQAEDALEVAYKASPVDRLLRT